MFKKVHLLILATILMAACGGGDNNSNEGPEDIFDFRGESVFFLPKDQLASSNANEALSLSEQSVFALGSDFVSPSQLHRADAFEDIGDFSNLGIQNLGYDAAVRIFNEYVYIINRGGPFVGGDNLDNIQILDPSSDFSTVDQWSTGNGTNPQDVYAYEDKLFITLYNPESDESNVDDNGNPGDLLIMNTQSGEVLERISFYTFLKEDDYRFARATRMARVLNKLYVLLQDLGSGPDNFQANFEQNASGKLAIIDLDTHEVDDVISLAGRNPIDIEFSSQSNQLFVTHLTQFTDFPLPDLDLDFGGIEVIPVDNPSNSFLIHDEDLEGYAEYISVRGDYIYTIISSIDPNTFQYSSRVARANVAVERANEFETIVNSDADARDIYVDPYERLWLPQRVQIFDQNVDNFWIEVFNADDGASLEIFQPTSPVISIDAGAI